MFPSVGFKLVLLAVAVPLLPGFSTVYFFKVLDMSGKDLGIAVFEGDLLDAENEE